MAIGARARLASAGRRAQVRIGCEMIERCAGRVIVRDARGTRLGARSFRIPAGRTRTVDVRLRRPTGVGRVAVSTVTRDLARHSTETTRHVLLAG
jgi:hypothetical protein